MKNRLVLNALSVSVLTGSLAMSCPVLAESSVANEEAVSTIESLNQEARMKVKGFAQQLQKTLKHELQANGFQSAVNVCNVEAPKIEATSSDGLWTVSRTSLKVRNSGNVPTEWEKAILEKFEAQAASGANIKNMEYSEVVDNQFRYMKAIPTGKVCLACHGTSIQPELGTRINDLYPQDQAIGFSLGQLRGAFSLTRSLKEDDK